MSSTTRIPTRTLLSAVLATLLAPAAAIAAVGPSTSVTPYLTPIDETVEFTSLLTVGD